MCKISKRILSIVLIASVIIVTLSFGIIEGDFQSVGFPFMDISDPEIEDNSHLDLYELDNIVDARKMQTPNGNKMNVIMMIPDGQSLSEQTLARWYQGYRLGTDKYICGLVRTYDADSAITDSSAAATAYATGYKTNEGYEGVLPHISNMPGAIGVSELNDEMPFATVLEAARLAGKSTGMVVTAPIMHATPAGFSSHVNDRRLYAKIAKQQINSGIDVMLGGGSYYLRDGRDDGRDLISDALKLGYSYVTDAAGLEASSADRLLGTFASIDMNYDFDRTSSEPTLEQMTKKAIEVLNRNENGFFLLVEGSKIDYASHAHDPVGVISESLSFDRAFRAATEFAEADGNTVVISCADHGNGGMSIGVGQSGYASMNISAYLEPLKRAKLTGAGVYQHLNADKSNIRYEVEKYYGISDLTDDEVNKIKNTDEVMAALGSMMSKRANIGWTGGGHTGEEVPLAVFDPRGNGLTGVVDNTDISHYMQETLGVSTDDVTQELFIPARSAFSGLGASIRLETISSSRSVLIIEKDDVSMRLPVDTSVAVFDDAVCRLSGVTVVSGGRSYVCRDAVELFENVLSGKQ